MGRCGCADKCGCRFVAGPGMKVTGAGSLDDPVVISTSDQSWGTGCLSAARCIPSWVGTTTAATGSGDNTKMKINLSSKANNTLAIGGDGGLFKPPGTAPIPAPDCTVTLANLPASRASGGPGLVIGRSGYGENVMPWNMAKSIRAAVDDRLDAVHVDVSGLADGTSVLAPYYYFGTVTDPDDGSIPGVGRAWTTNSGNYTGFRFDQITLPQWKSLTVVKDAVDAPDPTWPSWFGGAEYYQFGADTTSEMLSEVAGKINIFYRLPKNNLTTGAVTNPLFTGTVFPTHLAANKALLTTLNRHCVSQSSVIIANRQYQDVTTPRFPGETADTTAWAAAGYQTGVWLEFDGDLALNPPAALLAAGIKWVFIPVAALTSSGGTYGAAAAAYVNAVGPGGSKLNVVYIGLNRRVNKPVELTYGVRGVCCVDPLYYSERIAPRTSDIWPISIGGNGGSAAYMSGQLHDGVSSYDYRPYTVRGEGSRNPSGGSNPKNFDGGWMLPNSGLDAGSFGSAIVLGWASPVANTQQWEMTWWQRWNVFGSNGANYGGIVWSLADDARLRDGAGGNIPANFYIAGIRQSGELFLNGRANGLDTPNYASQGPALVNQQWYKLKLTVSASEARLYVYDTTIPGPTPIFANEVRMPNAAHRNGYLAMSQSTQSVAGPRVCFRKIRINQGDGNPWYE